MSYTSDEVAELFEEAQGLGRPVRWRVVAEYGEPRYLTRAKDDETLISRKAVEKARRGLAIDAAIREERRSRGRPRTLTPDEARRRLNARKYKYQKRIKAAVRAARIAWIPPKPDIVVQPCPRCDGFLEMRPGNTRPIHIGRCLFRVVAA